MPTWAKWLIGCGVAGLLLVLLAVGAAVAYLGSVPHAWHAESSVEVAAGPDEILPLLKDLRRWPEWSAWTRDTADDVEREYAEGRVEWSSGNEVLVRGGGVTVSTGSSNDDAGAGVLELVDEGAEKGLALRTTYHGALSLSRRDEDGGGVRMDSVRIGEIDGPIVVTGRIRCEATDGGARVTWSEDGDFGDGLAAKLVSAGARSMVEELHNGVLAASLERLKQKIEGAK